MSDRLVDAFDFHGRLSRNGSRRLAARLMAVALVGWLAPLFLLMAGAPRFIAWLPFSLLPLIAVAGVAASVRRLHDVGRDARLEWLKRLGALILTLGLTLAPVFAILAVPDLPAWAVWSLLGVSAAIFVAAVFRGRPEWGPGDPGPNRFGPPPE